MSNVLVSNDRRHRTHLATLADSHYARERSRHRHDLAQTRGARASIDIMLGRRRPVAPIQRFIASPRLEGAVNPLDDPMNHASDDGTVARMVRLTMNSSKNRTSPLTCIVCMDRPPNVVLVPCGHFCMCRYCALIVQERTNDCPYCRRLIRRVHTVIMP